MFKFVDRKSALGIEISDFAVRLAALSGSGRNLSLQHTNTSDLPSGMVATCYASLNILDSDGLVQALKECLPKTSRAYRRSALSLPDSVFRTQVLEFDELPSNYKERERLIRWRIEKTAAFDLSETILRHQELPRHSKGYAVLVCVAKQAVISQYEAVLREAGLEPWSIGFSSSHILNFYTPLLIRKSQAFALAHLTEESFATMIAEAGGMRFYRYKEVKQGSLADTRARFMREIEDSLHFYTHRDRTQTSGIYHLYLTGESSLARDLAAGLSGASLKVEVLSPNDVLSRSGREGTACPADMAAALGAWSAL